MNLVLIIRKVIHSTKCTGKTVPDVQVYRTRCTGMSPETLINAGVFRPLNNINRINIHILSRAREEKYFMWISLSVV